MADGRVVWLGRAADLDRRRTRRVIELPGAVALPGLVDAHAHPGWLGHGAEQLDLGGETSVDAIARRVASAPGTGWIRGFGWDEARWSDGRLPDHRPLSRACPDRPVVLHRHDRHAAWVNAAALRAAGIDRATVAPSGGAIARDTGGAPTGLLYDDAIRLVLAAEPAPQAADRQRWLRRAVQRFHAAGLTGVHDLCADPADALAWRALEEAGAARLRVQVYVDAEGEGVDATFAPDVRFGEWVRVRGVKLFGDGALGSRSAWLSQPYSDASAQSGQPVIEPKALARRATDAVRAGRDVAIHAIGDAANRAAVAALAAARQAAPQARLRLEHAQVVDPQTLARLEGLGVIAGVQPSHRISDANIAPARLGPIRLPWAYRLASLARAGASLVFGSDCPIDALGPLAAIRAAIGHPSPDERLSLEAALHASTVASARAVGAGPDAGRIDLGAPADVTVLSDWPERWSGTTPLPVVRATIVGGACVWGPSPSGSCETSVRSVP